jgi:hypothetical protein
LTRARQEAEEEEEVEEEADEEVGEKNEEAPSFKERATTSNRCG